MVVLARRAMASVHQQVDEPTRGAIAAAVDALLPGLREVADHDAPLWCNHERLGVVEIRSGRATAGLEVQESGMSAYRTGTLMPAGSHPSAET